MQTIEKLILNEGIINFYVGNQRNFNHIVYLSLKEMKRKYPQISYAIALAYLPTEKLMNSNENALYPEGIESMPKRFAISWKNNLMISHSEYVICYISSYNRWRFKIC